MANLIRLKRSAVPGKVPGIGDLQLSELAVNTFDGRLFLKRNNGTEAVVEVGALPQVDGGSATAVFSGSFSVVDGGAA